MHEEFRSAQTCTTGLLRFLVVFQGADDRHRHIEFIFVFGITVLEVFETDEGIDFVAVLQCLDIADVQVAGNVAEIYAAGAPAQADGKQYRLFRRDGQTRSQFCCGRTVFHPEAFSQFRVIRLLGQEVHQSKNRHLVCVIYHSFLFWLPELSLPLDWGRLYL